MTIDDVSVHYGQSGDAVELTQTSTGIALSNHGINRLDLAAPQRLTITTGEGADTIRLDSNGASTGGGSTSFITFDLLVDAGGQVDDSLVIINASDTTADELAITDDAITATDTRPLFGVGATLQYLGLDHLSIDTSAAGASVTIQVDQLATQLELNMADSAVNTVRIESSLTWDTLSIEALSASNSVIDLSAIDQTVPSISMHGADRLDLSDIEVDTTSVGYSEVAETITVADAGIAGVTQMTTTAGGGSTLVLSKPITALTLSAGDGATDTVVVNGLGAGFAGGLAIDASNAADEVRWRAGSTDLAGLLIHSGSILLDSDAIAVSDEMRFSGSVKLARNISLTADAVVFENSLSTVAAQALSVTAARLDLQDSATLGSLQVHAPASVAEDATIEFNLSGDITATGLVDIDLPLTVISDVTIAGSLLQLESIDAAVDTTEGTPAALTLKGPARLVGDIGARLPLNSLDVQASTILASSIHTLTAQHYAGAVQLLSDLLIEGDADLVGPISGTGSLTTLGEITLRGTNTFQGALTALAGSLNVLGSVQTDVFVSNGILTGNGHLAGDLTFRAGGWLMPAAHKSQWLTIDGTVSLDSEGGLVLTGSDAATIGRVIAHQVQWNDAELYDDLSFAPLVGEQLSFVQASIMHGQLADLPSLSFITVGGADALLEYLVGSSTQPELLITGYGDGDYGDAPFDSFKSEIGAVHRAAGPMLGSSRGSERDGFTGDLQDDGVQVIGLLTVSSTSATQGAVTVTASANSKLDAWIDFNQDGDWEDAGEQIFVSRSLSSGANALLFNIPSGSRTGESYARFRLSSNGGLDPTGIALDGEVEDHLFSFTSATTAQSLTIAVSAAATDIALESNQIVIRMAGQIVSRMPISAMNSLNIEGDNQNNSVTIDASAIPAGGLWVRGNGSGDFDTLSVRQSTGGVTLLTHDFLNAHDGSVVIDGKSIHYTGLEPILDSAAASQRQFVFGDGDDVVTLSDSGTASDNTSRLTSVNSSEAVDFANPTASLMLDLGEGDNRLVIGNLDTGLTVPMTLRFGNGTDELLGSNGNLSLSGIELQKAEGVLNVTDRVTANSLVTSGGFALNLAAGGQFANAMTFGNAGGVRLGDAAAYVFDFVGGLNNLAGPTTVNAIVRTQNKPITLSEVILTGNTTLAGSTITLGDITGVGDLTLTGNVLLNGSINIDGELRINGQLTLGTSVSISAKGTTVFTTSVSGGFDIANTGPGTLRLARQGFAGQLLAQSGTVDLPAGFTGQLVVDGGTAIIAGTLSQRIIANAGVLRIGSGIQAVTLDGDLDLSDSTVLELQANGNTPGTGYDQLIIAGNNRVVDLANATLSLTLGFTPVAGRSYTVLSLISPTSTILGEFAGLPQNGLLQIGDSQFTINYAGGDGNDIVLTSQATAAIDFGDAPASFGTLSEDDGARHLATGPTLGVNRDSEVDGLATDLADGDDSDNSDSGNTVRDEDGISQTTARV